MNPLLIFPEELWRMIFDKVESPEDLMSVQGAHLELRRILNATRTTWMFKKVFPHLVKHLEATDVLVSRQACQRWNKTIFQFFEQHPTIQRPHLSGDLTANNILQIRDEQYPAQRLFKGYPLRPQSVEELHDDPDRRRFLREHPILGRHVYLELYTLERIEDEDPNNADEEEEELVPIRVWVWSMNIQLMEAVLDELNESTWFLTIEALRNPVEGHFYNNFVTCLKHLPNLKCVILTARSSSAPTEAELEVNENLPPLPYLESIVVDGSYLCWSFAKVLRFLYQTYGGQLKNVKISSRAFWEVHHSKDYAVLDKLERLELWTVRENQDESLPFDEELCDTWKRLSCPALQILKMDVHELKIRTVFQILQSCPSLVVLKLSCHKAVPEVLPELEEGFQGPQNLKVLEVSDAALVAENFLGKVPSLEVIVFFGCEDIQEFVENGKPVRIKIKNALRFTPDGGQIYASNIWKLLPRLVKFHAVTGNGQLNDPTTSFRYTRETYESLQNLKGVE